MTNFDFSNLSMRKCDDAGCGAYATWVLHLPGKKAQHFCKIHAEAHEAFNNEQIYCKWEDNTVKMDEKKKWLDELAEAESKAGGLLACSSELYEQIVANGGITPGGNKIELPPVDKVCQTVVMRKDLSMHKGKIAAQASHGFMKDLLTMWKAGVKPESLEGADKEYYMVKFRKIVLAVNSEAELDDLYNKAKAARLKVHMIIDSGETEFKGVPTKTCICIGPHFKSQIHPITEHLKPF